MSNVTRDFRLRIDKAAVAGVTLHDLRRAAITHWARKFAVAVVKELAGRADISTTLRHYVSIGAAGMADGRNVAADAQQADAKWTQNEVKAVR